MGVLEQMMHNVGRFGSKKNLLVGNDCLYQQSKKKYLGHILSQIKGLESVLFHIRNKVYL